MRGSVVYQVQTVFKESGINKIGCSKHQDKEAFRASLTHKKANWHDIGQNTGIYSYSTADDYREIWISAFKHAKVHFSVKHIEQLTGEHIESYLLQKINDNVAHATFQKYAAALEKLAVALRWYANKNDIDRKYDFSDDILKARSIAHEELDRTQDVRAYDNPKELINSISDPLYKMLASIQYHGGARADEVFGITKNSMVEIGIRPYTNETVGIISVKGKGGKIRDIYVPENVYQNIKFHLQNYKNMQFDIRKYLEFIKNAAITSNQKYNGSHGLRWNFAQNRMNYLQKAGLLYEQCLIIVSHEMGHERADITLHYIK